MKKVMPIVLLLLLVISNISCKKNNSSPNTSGDYFTCFINGQSFNAGGTQSFVTYMRAEISQKNHVLLISGGDDNQEVSLDIYDSSGVDSKNYFFHTSHTIPYSQLAEYQNYSKDMSHGYYTDSVYTGYLNIQIDTVKLRATGSFYFRAKFQLYNDTVNISNGKFSLPLLITQ